MRKFYAFIAAALMSASMFAAAPTAADLLNDGYDPTANVVLCINPIEEATVCNDIYFVGSFSDWAESFTACPKFKALTGFDGWYVAEVAYAEGFQGKPIQAQSDGSFSWDYQAGDQNAWVHVAGLEAMIEAGFGDEANVSFGSAGAYIYQIKYWKKHKTPCVAVVKHQYTITLYAPDACADMKPAISGDDMGWGTPPIAMTEDMDDDFNTIYTYSFVGQEGHGFKIREVNDDSNWSNQMQFYNDTADAWWTFDNIELTADSNIVLNWSDNDHYRFSLCTGEPIDTTDYKVYVMLMSPAGAPAEGVEIIGSFNNWLNEPAGPQVILAYAEGVYYGIIDAARAGHEFTFRQANNWDNKLMMIVGEELKDLQPKFGEVWLDAEGLIEGATASDKLLALDCSDDTKFAWKVPQGIEEVVLTEKAQKVMVDGVLYIIRDNKMYNVQGTQVR